MVNAVTQGVAQPADSPNQTPPNPKLAENMAKMSALAAIVLDDSGTRSDTEKAAAYNDIHTMVVTNQIVGSGKDGQALFNKVFESDTGQRIYNLQIGFTQSVNTAFAAGTGQNLGRMMVDAFDTYSTADQAILFEQVISPINMTGGRQYADEASWRANVRAKDTLQTYLASSQERGVDGSDPKHAEARKLFARVDTSSASWTAMVLKLFGETADYRLDLSSQARGIVDGGSGSKQGLAAYEVGSIASRRV